MLSAIFSFAYMAFAGFVSLVLFPIGLVIWLLTVLFDRRLVILQQFTCVWGSLFFWAVPNWRGTVIDRHKIRRGGCYMVVSNHQSLVDIILAFNLFFHFKWVSKASIFLLPFIGWNMLLVRYIKINRGDKKSVKGMMAACERTLAEGSSIFLFPEGTRSKTGIMKEFKSGAFVLAKKMEVPILPIAINGTKNALPKHSLRIVGTHRMSIKVLDEIPYAHFKDMPVGDLKKLVWARISEHVAEHKALDENQ